MKGLTFNALEHHFEANLNVKCCVRATNNQLNFPRLSKSSLTGSWRITLAVSNKLKKITPGPYTKTKCGREMRFGVHQNIFCFKS